MLGFNSWVIINLSLPVEFVIMTSFEIGFKNPSEMTKPNTVSEYFPISIYSNANQFYKSFPCIYKQLHITLILLTEITIIKPVVLRCLKTITQGKGDFFCIFPDSLNYQFFEHQVSI